MPHPESADALRAHLTARLGRTAAPAWDAALDLGDWIDASGAGAVSARALEALYGRSRSVMHALDVIHRRLSVDVLREAGALASRSANRRDAAALRDLTRQQLYRAAQAPAAERAAVLRRELERAPHGRQRTPVLRRGADGTGGAGFQLHIRRAVDTLDARSAAAYTARVAGVVATLARLGSPAMAPGDARAAAVAFEEAARRLRERSNSSD